MLTFTLANDAAGRRVGSFTSNGVLVTLPAEPLFKLRKVNPSNGTLTVVSSETLTANVVSSDANGFQFRFLEAGAGAVVDIFGTVLGESLILRAKVVLGADNAALAFDGIEIAGAFSNFDGTAANNFVALPSFSGAAVQDPATRLTAGQMGEQDISYPGFETVPENPGFIGYVHLWGDVAQQGIYVGTTEVRGALRRFQIARKSAGVTRIAVRMFPPNNRAAAGGSDWDADWGVEYRVILGDEWDGARFYRERMIALGHPLFLRGEWAKRTDLNPARLKLRAFFYMSPDAAVTDAGYVKLGQNVSRTANELGVGHGESYGTLYDWMKAVIDNKIPDWLPGRDGSIDCARHVRSRGILLNAYTNHGMLHSSTAFYAAAGMAGRVVLNLDQSPYEHVPGEVDPEKIHHVVDMETAATRKLLYDEFHRLLRVHFGAGMVDGSYEDAYNAFLLYPNRRAASDPLRKGPGGYLQVADRLAYIDEQRAAFIAENGRHPLLTTEHPNDHCAAPFDLVGVYTVDPLSPVTQMSASARRPIPTMAIAWSRYMQCFPYDVFGAPITSGLVEGLSWNLLHHLSRGLIMGWAVFQERGFNVPTSDEPEWNTWYLPWGKTYYRLARKCVRAPRQWFQFGELLRAPTNSLVRWMVRNGPLFELLSPDPFAFRINVAAPPWMSHVWWNPVDDSVAIFVGNARSAAATYTDSFTVAKYPKLNAANGQHRILVEHDILTGEETFVQKLDVGQTLNLTVDVAGYDLRLFVLRPVGSPVIYLGDLDPIDLFDAADRKAVRR